LYQNESPRGNTGRAGYLYHFEMVDDGRLINHIGQNWLEVENRALPVLVLGDKKNFMACWHGSCEPVRANSFLFEIYYAIGVIAHGQTCFQL
jgi:hypothetical protein